MGIDDEIKKKSKNINKQDIAYAKKQIEELSKTEKELQAALTELKNLQEESDRLLSGEEGTTYLHLDAQRQILESRSKELEKLTAQMRAQGKTLEQYTQERSQLQSKIEAESKKTAELFKNAGRFDNNETERLRGELEAVERQIEKISKLQKELGIAQQKFAETSELVQLLNKEVEKLDPQKIARVSELEGLRNSRQQTVQNLSSRLAALRKEYPRNLSKLINNGEISSTLIKSFPSGTSLPVKVVLDTSNKKHDYISQEDGSSGLGRALKKLNIPSLSVTQIASLLTGGFPDFGKQSEQLASQIKSYSKSKPEGYNFSRDSQFQEMLKQWEKATQSFYNLQNASIRGTGAHKLVELDSRGKINLDTLTVDDLRKIEDEDVRASLKLYGTVFSPEKREFRETSKEDFSVLSVAKSLKQQIKDLGLGDVSSSEQSLGVLVKLGDKLVEITGTYDAFLQQTGTLLDLKTSQTVDPRKIGIQLNILKWLAGVNGIGVNGLRAVHAPFKGMVNPSTYEVGEVGDEQVLDWIQKAFEISEGREKTNKQEIPILKKSNFGPYDFSVQVGKDEKGNPLYETRHTSQFNGIPLFDFPKAFRQGTLSFDDIKEEFLTLSPDEQQQFAATLWSTKDYSLGTEREGTSFYRKGPVWDKLREIIPSMYSKILSSSADELAKEGFSLREFQSEEGEWITEPMLGGTRASAWGKLYKTAKSSEEKGAVIEKLFGTLEKADKKDWDIAARFLGKLSSLDETDDTALDFEKALNSRIKFTSLERLWNEGIEFRDLSKEEQKLAEERSQRDTLQEDVFRAEERRIESLEKKLPMNDNVNPLLKFLGYYDETQGTQVEMTANRFARLIDLFPRINKIFEPLSSRLSSLTGDTVSAENLARTYLSTQQSWIYDKYLRSKEINSNFQQAVAQGGFSSTDSQIQWLLSQIQNPQSEEESQLYDAVTELLRISGGNDGKGTLLGDFKSIFGSRINHPTKHLDQLIGMSLVPDLGRSFGIVSDEEKNTIQHLQDYAADAKFGELSYEEWLETPAAHHIKDPSYKWGISKIKESDFSEKDKQQVIDQIEAFASAYSRREGVSPDWDDVRERVARGKISVIDENFEDFLTSLDIEDENKENERYNEAMYKQYKESFKQKNSFLSEIPKEIIQLLVDDIISMFDEAVAKLNLSDFSKNKPNRKKLNNLEGFVRSLTQLGVNPDEMLGEQRVNILQSYRRLFDKTPVTSKESIEIPPSVEEEITKSVSEVVNNAVSDSEKVIATEESSSSPVQKRTRNKRTKTPPKQPDFSKKEGEGIPDVHVTSATRLSEEEMAKLRKSSVTLDDKGNLIAETYKLVRENSNKGKGKGVFTRIESEVRGIHQDTQVIKDKNYSSPSNPLAPSGMFDFILPEGISPSTAGGGSFRGAVSSGARGGARGSLSPQYLELLREEYRIKLEIFKLDKQREVLVAKEENTSGVDKRKDDLALLGEEVKAQRIALETSFNDRQRGVANNKIAAAEAKLRYDTDTYQSQYSVEQQIKAEREYEQLLNQRLRIEKQIETAKRNISVSYTSREKQAQQNIIDMSEKELEVIDRKVGVLERSNLLRKEEADSIFAQYQIEQASNKAQTGSLFHGARSIWDLMGMDIRRSISRVFDYGLAFRILNSIPRAFSQVYNLTQQLNDSLTNLRIVTGYNAAQGNQLIVTYQKLGKELGATTQEVANSANEWLRQGYSAQEAGELIDASLKLSKLGMIESSEATQYLTSALKGFKMEAEEAMSIVDKLTKTDMDAAVSAGGIAEALSRTATSAQLAGLGIDETIGIVATIGEVTQKSMQSVGESVKTLLSRFGNVKAGVFDRMNLEEGGEETENINDIEKVLGKLGISIRNSALEMRNIGDVLDDLAERWVTLDTVSKNAVATAFAGVRQRENFNVLMENYDRAKELTEESADSAGTAESKYVAYMDSVGASLKKLTNAWEDFTIKLKSSDLIKVGADTLSWFISHMDDLLRIVSAVASAFLSLKLPTWLQNFGKNGLWNGGQPVAFLSRFIGKDSNYLISRHNAKVQAAAAEGKTLKGPKWFTSEWEYGQGAKTRTDAKTQAITSAVKETTSAVEEQSTVLNEIAGGVKQIVAKTATPQTAGGVVPTAGNAAGKWENGVFIPSGGKLGMTRDAEGNIRYIRNGKITQQKVSQKKQEAFIQAELAQKEKEQAAKKEDSSASSSGGKGGRLATGIVTGITTGVTSGLTTPDAGGGTWGSLFNDTGQTVQADTADKALTGVITGSLAGAGAAFLGPLGAMLGQIVGDFFSQMITFFRHQDELERKERVEEARKQLEALQNFQTSLDAYTELNVEDLWAPEDYAQAKKYVDELEDVLKSNLDLQEKFVDRLRKNVDGLENVDLGEAIDLLINGTKEERDEVQKQLQLAKLEEQKEQQIAAGEEVRYLENLLLTEGAQIKREGSIKTDSLSRSDYITGGAGLISTDKGGKDIFENMENQGYITLSYNAAGAINGIQINGETGSERYSNAQKVLKALKVGDVKEGIVEDWEAIVGKYEQVQNDAGDQEELVKEIEVLSAYIDEGISDLTLQEQEDLGYEGIIYKIADAMEASGIEVRDSTGVIKDEYLSLIKEQINSDSNLTKVLQKETLTIENLFEAEEKLTEASEKLKEALSLGTINIDETILNKFNNFETPQDFYNFITYLTTYLTPENKALLEEIASLLSFTTAELVGLTNNANPDNLDSIATAFHTTTEEIRRLKDLLGSFSLADALMSPSEVREKYQDYFSFMEELVSGAGLSADSLEKIITSYPTLLEQIQEGGDTLRNYLVGFLNGKDSAYTYLYENSLFGDLLADSAFFDKFKKETNIGELIPEALKEVWGNAKTFDEAKNILFKVAGEQGEEIQKILEDYFSFDITYEIDTTLLDSVIEGLSSLYDKQIENLEEQLETLDSINEEREKEINLIKAKQKLEDAQNEKVAVYRAGIGFVYEANAEAIKEAQEELEDLQTEQQKASLQAEIDRLTAEQERLEDIPDREEINALKSIYEEWAKEISESNENQVNILSRISEIYTKLGSVNFGQEGFIGQWEASQDEQVEKSLTAIEQDWNELKEIQNEIDSSSSYYEKYNKMLEYNAKLEELNTSLGKANNLGLAESDINQFSWSEGMFAAISSGEKEFSSQFISDLISEEEEKFIASAATEKEQENIARFLSLLYGLGYKDQLRRLISEGGYSGLSDFIQKVYTENAHSDGSLSLSQGGISLINEKGTEALITPQGTLTALPSRTGIVPADITENLWHLGEIAPNLIQEFKESDMGTLSESVIEKFLNSNDGFYIDNLSMQVYPQEGYDIDQFVSEIKAKARISRNN